jgi:hypothetical protein
MVDPSPLCRTPSTGKRRAGGDGGARRDASETAATASSEGEVVGVVLCGAVSRVDGRFVGLEWAF